MLLSHRKHNQVKENKQLAFRSTGSLMKSLIGDTQTLQCFPETKTLGQRKGCRKPSYKSGKFNLKI